MTPHRGRFRAIIVMTCALGIAACDDGAGGAVYKGLTITRVASEESLDAPWGVAIAPPDFGYLGGALPIANTGDGVYGGVAAATFGDIPPLVPPTRGNRRNRGARKLATESLV